MVDAADPVIVKAAALSGCIWPSRLLTPPLLCPSCRRAVLGPVSAAGVDPDDPLSVATARWSLFPCGCLVDRFWVVAAAREIEAREKAAAGAAPPPPGRVAIVAEQLRQCRLIAATARLQVLYTLRSAAIAAGMGGARALHEREICALMTDLATVLPLGVTPDGLPPISLLLSVSVWASKFGLRLPAGSRPGDRPERLDGLSLTWDMVRTAVEADPDAPPDGWHASEVERLTDVAFGQIRVFVETGRTLSAETLALLVRVGPGLTDRLFASLEAPQAPVEVASDVMPAAEFAASLAVRRRRRLERRSQ